MADNFPIDLFNSASPPPSVASVYNSAAGVTALVSVVVLFLICTVAVFARRCFINHPETGRNIETSPHGQLRIIASSSPSAHRLDDAAVAALPVVRYAGRGRSCAVCLEEYGGEQKVKVIPGCGHVFHPECIDVWLRWRKSCPVCRCSDLWASSGGLDVWLDVFVCGEANGGRKLGRSKSCERCAVVVEEGGGGGAADLRRTCSV